MSDENRPKDSPDQPPPAAPAGAPAGQPRGTPSWLTEDPFTRPPAGSDKVALDPGLQAELARRAPSVVVPPPLGPGDLLGATPAGHPPAGAAAAGQSPPAAIPGGMPPAGQPPSSTPPPAAAGASGPAPTGSAAGLPAEPTAAEPPASRRLPRWGWLVIVLAGVGVLFLVADLRNRNRYSINCSARKVELLQGRRLPWPFGREAVGGPEYKPINIPAEADCRPQTFSSEEEAARVFLDILLAQIRGALANPGGSNLREARQQLQQALLLTRTQRARRKDAESMLAELSYREGRAGLARAENELRLALSRFQESRKLDAQRFDDLDDWIAHLEEMLRSISPTPFSPGRRLAPGLPSGPPPASRPAALPPVPAPKPGGPAPQPPPPPPDAGSPASSGGILM